VYSDSLLLIDALERYEPTALETMETAELVNLYTLCSDVQRNADDLRQNVRSLLLDRLYTTNPSMVSTDRSSAPVDAIERSKTTRPFSNYSKLPTSRSRTSTRSTKASTSAKPMSTKNVRNRACRVSRINSLLLTTQKQTSSNEKSKISKLVSTNSPALALPAKSTENPLSKEW